MSNRTDFETLALEWLEYEVSPARATPALVARLATELHNAFVAGQEAEDARLHSALAEALDAIDLATSYIDTFGARDDDAKVIEIRDRLRAML